MKKFWIGSGLISALMAAAFTLASCGGSDTKTEAPKAADAGAAPAGGAAATPDMDNGGTITGKVAFDGTAPKMAVLDVSANPVCAKAHATEPLRSEQVVVNGNGTLKNVFVWVVSNDALKAKTWQVPTTAVTIDQNGCEYKPHVIALMAGQNLDIKNSDPTNHNIHPQPTVNQEFNESQAPGTPDITKTFPREEIMMPVKCNVHNWMRSYINVVSHPFFAVTGDDGTYTIKGLPPGSYTIEIVHEKYGKQDQQVTVGAKETKTADFTVKG